MLIIAGLGNPGKEYENTRHNAGFMVMDALAEKIGADISEKKHKALCGKGVIGGEKVILMKPQTYMNSSGESIRVAWWGNQKRADATIAAFDAFAKESGVNYASQLLTTGKIETVLDQLNAYQRNAEAENTVTADQLYVNAKAPFGYNYIDGNFDVTHDNDSNGSHGSHVSGIAAANRYLKTEDGYVDALEAVNVAGNAPDAAQVAEYAIPAFQWAVGAGIINGTTATTLSPKGSATRGQVAAILHRYCEWIG